VEAVYASEEKGSILPLSRRKTLLPFFCSAVSTVCSFPFLSKKESWLLTTSVLSLRFITKLSLNLPEFLNNSKAWLISPSRVRPRTS
jgi:hypothetical protein